MKLNLRRPINEIIIHLKEIISVGWKKWKMKYTSNFWEIITNEKLAIIFLKIIIGELDYIVFKLDLFRDIGIFENVRRYAWKYILN